MSLDPVVPDRAGKIIRLSGGVPDHDAPAGADIVFARNAFRPVLHIMACRVAGKDFVYPPVVGFAVFRMDMILPDVSRTVHILRRQAVGVHGGFGPAGEVILHITEIDIGSFRNHFE